jgi:hypothetical protein
MARRKVRRVALAFAVVAFAALLTDRVVLYVWGLGVRGFYGSLHRNVDSAFRGGGPTMSLTEIRWDEISFMQGEDGPTDLNFMKSSVRPDCIRMDRHGIRLWYLPPALAWTTRLYPFYSGTGTRPRSYRPVDHYQYMLVMHGKGGAKPVVELYAGPEQTAVPLTAKHPDVFP